MNLPQNLSYVDMEMSGFECNFKEVGAQVVKAQGELWRQFIRWSVKVMRVRVFYDDESGAVTVDVVGLIGAVVALGLSTAEVVRGGLENGSDDVRTTIEAFQISTSFASSSGDDDGSSSGGGGGEEEEGEGEGEGEEEEGDGEEGDGEEGDGEEDEGEDGDDGDGDDGSSKGSSGDDDDGSSKGSSGDDDGSSKGSSGDDDDDDGSGKGSGKDSD
jgi:hypothetical protein